MSNVIKAMNIRYTQEKKDLDMNAKAEGFRQLYYENLAKAQSLQSDADEESDLEGEYDETDAGFSEESEELSEEENGSGGDSVKKEDSAKKHSKADSAANDVPVQFPAGNNHSVMDDINSLTDEQLNAILSSRNMESVSSFTIEKEKMKAEAREECDRIIEEARASLDVERETVFYEAKEQGYQEGLKAAQEECDALKQELTEKLSSIDREFEKKVDELEPAFVDLLINLIQKITGILVEDRRDLILHIIRQSILDMDNSNNYVIHVSKDDFDFVNSKKQELLFELKGNNIEVIEDPVLQRAQCTIETDTRIFDCSLDVQLKNLIADIRLLSGE